MSAGGHVITATVSDSEGSAAEAVVAVLVEDLAPSVAVTEPADGSVFELGTATRFAGTASDAEDGDLTGVISWTSSLQGAMGLGGALTSTLDAGTHVITATVVDAAGNAASAAVTVLAAALPPSVEIISPTDQTHVLSGEDIWFAGKADDAKDGDLATSIVWSSDQDGVVGIGEIITATLRDGIHAVTAVVTDTDWNVASDTITLLVGDLPPTVVIVDPADGSQVDSGTEIVFAGTAQDREDGDLAEGLSWTSSKDGQIGIGSVFTATLTDGEHVITAVATDSGGHSADDAIAVRVGDHPPQVTVLAPADGSRFLSGTMIIFNGMADDPEQGGIADSLVWSSSISGSLGTGPVVTATLDAGTHVITATAIDAAGNTAFDTVSVEVWVDTAPQVAIAVPTNGSFFSVAADIVVSGVATDTEDGNLSSAITWVSSVDGLLGTGDTLPVTLSENVHVITATVADSRGHTHSQTVIVEVGNYAPTVSIDQPFHGSTFPSGRVITFMGEAEDPEDGNISWALRWISDRDGLIGRGGRFQATLSNGTHRIVAEAGDSAGSVGYATLLIDVGPSPHKASSVATSACAGCHRGHSNPTPALVAFPAIGNALCLTCHDGSGARERSVSSHANTGYADRTEARFELQCVQCHDTHGSSNAYNVREYVQVQTEPLVTVGPITLVANEGEGSYDDGTGAGVSRLCVACHDNPANPGYPVARHVGGDHGSASYEGEDCMICHPHSADDDALTADGFMVSDACTACHSFPQENRRNVVGSGGDFGRAAHHVNGLPTDADCVACHDTRRHGQGQVVLVDADDRGVVYTIADDPRVFATEAEILEPFCVACHDGDGAGGSAPFSDGIMPPEIVIGETENPHNGRVTCFRCHNNGHSER